MRKIWLLLLLAPSALIYACGGDDSTTGDGGPDATGSDAANDVAQNKDTGTQDTGTQDTGAQDAGSDGPTLNITCLAPSQCDGGGVCCGTLSVSGSPGNCSISGASTACSSANQCHTSIAGSVTCTGTDTVRLCTANTDCTEQQYNKCCTFKQGDAGVNFCLNATLAGDAGTCM